MFRLFDSPLARLIVWLVGCAAFLLGLMLGSTESSAEPLKCTPYRVNATFLHVSSERDAKAKFVDLLDGGDIVCVGSFGPYAGDHWAYVLFKVKQPGERIAVDGWVLLRSLSRIRTKNWSEVSEPATGAEVPPTDRNNRQSAKAGLQDIVRFDQPVPFGPVPINGRSLKELADRVPMFPPVKEAENALWQKSCPSCHQWERQSICKQGETYLNNPRIALRQPHPFGGPFKVALMRWSKNGCQ
jgi:hypothetical protein